MVYYLNNSDSFLGQQKEFSFALSHDHMSPVNNAILRSNPMNNQQINQNKNVWSDGQWVPNYSCLTDDKNQNQLKNTIISKPFQKIELTKLGQNNSIIHLKSLRSGKNIPFLAAAHRIGIDWIPPMNANILVGPQIKFRNQKTITKTTSLKAQNLFRWDNLGDVQLKRYPNCKELPVTTSYCEDPQNQLTCGSCWSFGGAGFLTDRFRIWSQSDVPVLSPTVILACATKPNGNQCNGGNAQAVFDVCTSVGILSEEDAPYESWCTDTKSSCNSGDIPSCSTFSNNTNRYFGDSTSTLSAKAPDALACTYNTNYDTIIDEIWQNGPVMSGYYVFADFYGPIDDTKKGSSADPILWEETSGIYMNGSNIYSYQYNGKPSWNQKMGAHMIVIVGWGEKQIEGIVPQNTLFTGATEGYVPFWIIRNSWGSSWNANNINNTTDSDLPWLQQGGYFYVAMSGQYTINDTLTDVNKNIGLDHLVTTTSGKFGGCWFFGPKVTFVDMDLKCDGSDPDPDPDPDPNPDPNPDPDPKPDHRKKQIEKRLQNVIKKHKDLLKPILKKKTWFDKWNDFMLQLSSSNDESTCGLGACLWNNDQCLNTTETVCSLLSQGKGTFLSNRKCIDYINKKAPNSPESTVAYPCLLPDGSCLMVTEEIAKTVLPEGKLYYNLKSCAEAKYGNNSTTDKDKDKDKDKASNLIQLLKEIQGTDTTDYHIDSSLVKQILEDKKEKELKNEHLFFENDQSLLEYLIKQLMICSSKQSPSPSPSPSPVPVPVPVPDPVPDIKPMPEVKPVVSKQIDAVKKIEKKKEKETLLFQILVIVALVCIFLAIIIGIVVYFAVRSSVTKSS